MARKCGQAVLEMTAEEEFDRAWKIQGDMITIRDYNELRRRIFEKVGLREQYEQLRKEGEEGFLEGLGSLNPMNLVLNMLRENVPGRGSMSRSMPNRTSITRSMFESTYPDSPRRQSVTNQAADPWNFPMFF